MAGSEHEIVAFEDSYSAVQSIFTSTRCYDLMQSSSKVIKNVMFSSGIDRFLFLNDKLRINKFLE